MKTQRIHPTRLFSMLTIIVLGHAINHSPLLFCDFKTTSSHLKFDVGNDQSFEMTLSANGLAIGKDSASSTLDVAGNTLISQTIHFGGTSESSANLTLTGNLSQGHTTVSSSTTLGSHSIVLADSTTSHGSLELSLPTAATSQGQSITVKKITSSNTIWIISDELTPYKRYELSHNTLESAQFFCDGSSWHPIESHDNSALTSEGLHLNFNETTGTSLSDVSGYEHAVTLSGTNMNIATTAGNLQNAIQLDGIDDYLTISDSDRLDLSSTGTIALWVSLGNTTYSSSNVSSWTDVTAPTGAGSFSPGEVDITVVGNLIYYASAQHNDTIEKLQYGSSNLSFGGLSFTDFQTQPDGARKYESSSIDISSDGSKLYYISRNQYQITNSLYTGSSELDGSGFNGWRTVAPSTGGDTREKGYLDAIITNGNIYYGSFENNATNMTMTVQFGGSKFKSMGVDLPYLNWIQETSAPHLTSAGCDVSGALETDGKNLYIAISGRTNGTTGAMRLATSDLNYNQHSLTWVDPTTNLPDGIIMAYNNNVDMCLVGNLMIMGLQYAKTGSSTLHTRITSLEEFSTVSETNWTSDHASVLGPNAPHYSSTISMDHNGKQCFFAAWSSLSNGNGNLQMGSMPIDYHPIIFKQDAYELLQVGGGFVFSWAGKHYSFGSLQANTSHHIAITHSGNELTFYIDGVEVRQEITEKVFTVSTSPLKIGTDGSQYFQGTIDELRVSKRALSAEEIRVLFNTGSY